MNNNVNSQIPNRILKELYDSFLKENRENIVKFCVQIERAHWYYLDHFCEMNKSLLKLTFKEFATELFKRVHFLQIYLPNFPIIMQQFES